MPFEIGLSGPIMMSTLRDRLHAAHRGPDLPAGLGGTPVNILAAGLLDRGWRVVIYTLDPMVRQPVQVEGPGLRIHIGPYRTRHRARDAFAAERRALTEAMLADRVPLIHAHWAGEFAWAAQTAAARTSAAVLVTAHDAPIEILKFDPSPYRMVRTGMAIKILRKASHVTAVSEHVARHLRRFHLTRHPAEVIPNGLADSAFRPEPVMGHLKSSTGAPVIACILNGWGGLKNGKAALRAFSLLRSRCPQARLLLFGGGHGPGEAAEIWARANGALLGVEFLGFRQHAEVIRRLRDEVDILLHPSREEAQGLALVEALANGVVAIGGETAGSVPDCLDHGRAGVLTAIDDPIAMSDCLYRLITDHTYRTAMARSGYDHASRRFRSAAMISAYEALYGRLAAKR